MKPKCDSKASISAIFKTVELCPSLSSTVTACILPISTLYYCTINYLFVCLFHNQNPKRIFHSYKNICAWLSAAWMSFVSCVAISYSYCRNCHYSGKTKHWTISRHSETSVITKNLYAGKEKYSYLPSVYHWLLNPVQLVAGCM